MPRVVYMNSALATYIFWFSYSSCIDCALHSLNSRKHVIAKSQGTSDEPSSGRWNSIQMEPRRGRTQENAEVRIVVDQQSHVERDSDMVRFSLLFSDSKLTSQIL